MLVFSKWWSSVGKIIRWHTICLRDKQNNRWNSRTKMWFAHKWAYFARKILREGYYLLQWKGIVSSMFGNAICVRYILKKANQSPTPLHNMTISWHFFVWGMDTIGTMNSKATIKYIFYSCGDWLFYWVGRGILIFKSDEDTFSSRTISSVVMVCPQSIITDNVKKINDMMDDLCAQFKVFCLNLAYIEQRRVEPRTLLITPI